MPTVTVLMSCYNASVYLSEAIESILSQTYSDYEFILVNDGSTDGTLDILNRYAAEDGRIRIIDKENTGLADSLNVGIRAARGPWIARLDADDVALPQRLEEQVSFLFRHSGCQLLGSGVCQINREGAVVKRHKYPQSHDHLLSDLRRLKPFFGHSSAMFATEAAKRVGGYNPYYERAQDRDLWLRLAEYGKMACLARLLVKIRSHTEQISHHDNGRTQVLHGVAASVCHLVRMRGAVDPSSQSDADWRQFMEWLAPRVEQSGLFKQRAEWRRLRASYSSASNTLIGLCRLGKGLLLSKHVLTLIQRKWLGSNLAAQLAAEWGGLGHLGTRLSVARDALADTSGK